MKYRLLAAVISLFFIGGCSDGAQNGSTSAIPAANAAVAAALPSTSPAFGADTATPKPNGGHGSR